MTHESEDIDIEFPQASPERLHLHNRRQLSAMLDGELPADQARFMLRRLQHDAELAACWERWQVCGDVLRGQGHALLPADFSRRVAAAIAAPGHAVGAAARGRAPAARPPHRLLRWGGGALAASMALVALFMARQLPDPQAQGPHEAASAVRAAPASVVETAPSRVLAAAPGETGASPGIVGGAATSAESDGALPALLAAAPAAAVAVAEVPRRAGQQVSPRGQSQRAALRRSQGAADGAVQVAAAPVQASGASSLAALPPIAGDEGDALFGALPPATARPWPRAALPGSSRIQPFAAGYGMPQAEAFAPFQPRLEAFQPSLPATVRSGHVAPDPAEPGAAAAAGR